MILRDYQEEAVGSVMSLVEGGKSVVLQAPTGSGKTVMASEIIKRSPKPVLALVHSREILDQTVKTYQGAGLSVGKITAETATGQGMSLWSPDVVVAMVQTSWSRLSRGHDLGRYKTIVVDECHHVVAQTWRGVVDHWKVPIVGLTATPSRADGRGLGVVFDEIVQASSYRELIDAGWLVDAPNEAIWTWPVDLKGVRTSMGDYQLGGAAGAAARMNTTKRVGDCVSHWLKLCNGMRTIVFASSVDHSMNIVERFASQGVSARHVDGETPKDERDETRELLASGEVKVVSNFGIYTEGFDLPAVECIVLERPTKLTHLYLQMVGRGFRPAPGKDHLTVLDHVGAVVRLGHPAMDRKWQLDEGKAAAEKEEADESAPEPRPCPSCNLLMTQAPPCKYCGWQPVPQGGVSAATLGEEEDYEAEGQLVNLSTRQEAAAEVVFDHRGRRLYQAFLALAKRRGVKAGWAYHRYLEQTGEKPNDLWLLPDPRNCTPSEFFAAAKVEAANRGWRPGWAAVKFREIYERWPNRKEETAA